MRSISRALLLAPALLGAADFARDIEPLLRRRCHGCHGAATQSSGLRLDRRDDALRGGYTGPAIRPGDAASSRLIQLVSGAGKLRMPPAGQPLTGAEIAVLRDWIDAGAAWPESKMAAAIRPRAKPWSFQPVRKSPVPAGAANPVDAFVRAKLREKAIAPSPEAQPVTLIRRVTLDLTGRPPTPREVGDFLEDTRPGAYERLVDRLLESPRYGEKWARHWLDLARYADSEGGIQDYSRPFAWRWRQWVIDAFNRDMPFDRFTIEQLAGDLLPRATLDQKIAAGFHRNTVTSREGGIELDRLRFEQLVDRANTTGMVWLGLTTGCAQCHDHKYDPITQKDYYRLLAYFESADEIDEEAPLPGEWGVHRRYAAKSRSEREALIAKHGAEPLLAEWEEHLRKALADPGRNPKWDVAYDAYSKLVDHGTEILLKSPASRTERERDAILDFYLSRGARGALSKERYEAAKLEELQKALEKLDSQYPKLSTIMTLSESPTRRSTHLRVRGNYADRGIEVAPGLPEALSGAPAGDRLALARWLVSRDNPLTPRVAVNRFWQELFGRGIVRTSEDFGAQGEKPSHPELLDWLAAEFVDRGWSVKRMVRLLVTSASYRQSSNARPDLAAVDPANALLARQSRLRLPAELIRDSALAASGLLMESVGGASIRPPQPEGVADLQYSTKWEETAGRERYRRGLYVHIQRTAGYPLLMNFDAPDRTTACSRRESSTSPLQALNLMNDPVFVEAAEALAERISREGPDDAARAGLLFRLCVGRGPNAAERDLVQSHVARRRGWFGAARALLNADEFLTRE